MTEIPLSYLMAGAVGRLTASTYNLVYGKLVVRDRRNSINGVNGSNPIMQTYYQIKGAGTTTYRWDYVYPKNGVLNNKYEHTHVKIFLHGRLRTILYVRRRNNF